MNQVASKAVGRGTGGRSRALDVDHFVSLRIRQRRIMLGLTQQQIARQLGISQQAVSSRLQSGLWQESRRVRAVAESLLEGADL